MQICIQCGAQIGDGWPPCCPEPSECWHRYIRNLQPRKPSPVVPDLNHEKHPLPETLPDAAELKTDELIPVVSRRGSKHVKFYDKEGLGCRMVRWLRETGGTNGRFVKLRTMQNRLSLHRYSYWRDALSYLRKRKVVQVEGKVITLLDESWGPDRRVAKPKKRRRRTTWFEVHLPEVLERDGLL